MPTPSPTFEHALASVRGICADVAARHAADVDARARFPQETLDALKQAKLLSAGVPAQWGGGALTLREQALLCATLGQACGSSAMVLAMHSIIVACVVRHGQGSAYFSGLLSELVERQSLLASITSEVGTFGDTRSSICAVQREAGRFRLSKDATTGSYAAHADAILVTCRRDADAAPSDQVQVLVRKGGYSLEQTGSWDTLGMRGTCSPGFKLDAEGDEAQILPGSFADCSAQTMVPYSHILWSALWWGIAADAMARASSFVRGQARKQPGTVPPTAHALADASVHLQAMRSSWHGLAIEFDETGASADAEERLMSMGWALKLNNLKITASQAAPQIVHSALQIVGILGYKNDSPFSLGRHYRDVLSASLMVSNERIAAKNASMLLVHKDD